jgi:hypothetical protein
MAFLDDYDKQVSDNIRKIKLCAHVLEEVQQSLLDPFHPERQADLLLATEDLTSVSFELLSTVRAMVWHEDLKPAPEDS